MATQQTPNRLRGMSTQQKPISLREMILSLREMTWHLKKLKINYQEF